MSITDFSNILLRYSPSFIHKHQQKGISFSLPRECSEAIKHPSSRFYFVVVVVASVHRLFFISIVWEALKHEKQCKYWSVSDPASKEFPCHYILNNIALLACKVHQPKFPTLSFICTTNGAFWIFHSSFSLSFCLMCKHFSASQ